MGPPELALFCPVSLASQVVPKRAACSPGTGPRAVWRRPFDTNGALQAPKLGAKSLQNVFWNSIGSKGLQSLILKTPPMVFNGVLLPHVLKFAAKSFKKRIRLPTKF